MIKNVRGADSRGSQNIIISKYVRKVWLVWNPAASRRGNDVDKNPPWLLAAAAAAAARVLSLSRALLGDTGL